ncbi:MAG: DUF2341 domain-containing protein, partial [Thermoplasmata archaeon]
MIKCKKAMSKEPIISGVIFLMLICNSILTSIFISNPESKESVDNRDEIVPPGFKLGNCEVSSNRADNALLNERNTRSEFISGHIYPIDAANSDGDGLNYLELDEDASGDAVYEQSGDSNEPSSDWIEVFFPNAGIPSVAKVIDITYYFGYYTNNGWQLTADPLSDITWRVNATQNDLGGYSLSSPADTDIDTILVQTLNLPTAVNLNSGNFKVRFRGLENGGGPDHFYLDYCYFTVTYSIPSIVFNEIMADPPGGPYDGIWSYRKAIIIDHTKVEEDLADFPVLISIFDLDLAAKAQPDGDDILFTASDAETKLDHEITLYINATGELNAWVKVPLVSSTHDTVIYMYYGNSTAENQENAADVWSNNYRGVWHLDDTSGDTLDSSMYDFSATPDATIVRGGTGQIGNAYLFDGLDAEVDFGSVPDGHLDFGTNSMTLSCWANINETTGYQDLVSKGGSGSGSGGYAIRARSDGQQGYFRVSDTITSETNNFRYANGTWVYLVGVCDRNNNELCAYENGIEQRQDDDFPISGTFGGIDAAAQDFEIGDNSETPEGWLDEVRVSLGVRTAGWIKTEYNNQYSPSTFITVGSEEVTSGISPGYEWAEIYNYGDSSIDLSGWFLRDNDGFTFDLTGAGTIPPSGYLVCHLNQQGTNSTTDVYGMVNDMVIQPDATDGKDNYMLSNGATLNFGTGTIVSVRNDSSAEHRPIIQFDLSSAPENIENAKLWLYRSSGNSFSSNIYVHRLTQSWTELDSNWNTYDGTNSWATLGGDYDSTEESSTTVPPVNGWYSWDITDLVKGWVNGTYPNYGMLLRADYDDANDPNPYFRSSDYTDDTSIRPKLVINLTSKNLDYTDGLYLYNNFDSIVDFVAWGRNPDTDDDDAVSEGFWTDGEYVDTSSLKEGESFGRDRDSTDTNSPLDWEGPETGKADPFGIHAGSITQGAINMDQFIIINEVMFDPSGNPYDKAWDYKKKLTIHAGKVAGDLSDFPVVLDMTLWDLAAYAQPDGDDILFVGKDGDTKLAHEIELFNGTTGRLVVWIKIPFLSSTDDTIIYLYYGNLSASNQQQPHEVWTNGFVGVYHLKETGEPYINSVKNKNYGTQWLTPTQVTGKFGYGQEFTGNGEDDMISLGNLGLCDGTQSNLTVSAWSYIDDPSLEDYAKIISKRDETDSSYEYMLGFNADASDKMIYWNTKTDSTGSQNVAKSCWVHLAGTYDGSIKKFYINGSEATQDTDVSGPLSNSNWAVTIGAQDSPSQNFGGIIDEVRICNVDRSLEWVATEWYNQVDPSAFFSIDDCNNRKPITLNSSQVSGDLTDFPVFIHIIDSDLSSNARGDGRDIHFKSLDGSRLQHEIVSYDGSSGELKAYVRIPILSSTVDTTIYMYYNNPLAGDNSNPKGVWDDDYRGVWHLNEIPRNDYDGAILDSSSYMNHLESQGSMDQTNLVNGRIDGAFSFDGTDDYLYRDNYCSQSLDAGYSDFTIEAWVQLDSSVSVNYPTIVEKGGTASNVAGYWLFDYNSNNDFRMYFGDGDGSNRAYTDSKGNIEDDQWHHVVVTVDRDGPAIFYIDGKLDNLKAASSKDGKDISSPSRDFRISDAADTWDGLIDEARVSFTVRSWDWINTSYRNIVDAALFCSVGSEDVIQNWYNTEWSYRKNITINSSKVSGGVADFPVLVKITDSDLVAKARSDGHDIIFVQGQARLDHEIESYQSGLGELIAWVKVPWLSPTEDKIIQMYYGNSAQTISTEHSFGVWSNGYVGVYHMLEQTGSIENSVSLSNYGSRGDTPTRITGQIGYGQEFTGSSGDDRFILGDFGITDGMHDKLTLSFWINIDDASLDNWGRVILKRDETDSNTLWGAYLDDDGSDKDLMFNAGGDTGANTIGKSVWVYVSFTYDGAIKIHYHNGTEVRDDTGGGGPLSSTISSYPVTIGARYGGSQNFAGILDEVRISTVAHTADWVATEYNNQFDPPSFLYLGIEENTPSSSTSSEPVYYEWVELYNPSSIACSLGDLYLSDYEGNLFDLSGAGSLAAGGYLVAHLGETGMNSGTDVYGSIINYDSPAKSMLDDSDTLSVKSREGFIFDYIAWGSDPNSDDFLAMDQSQWINDEYIYTSEINENETIGRDKISKDMNTTFDWENPNYKADPFGINAVGKTPGAINLDQQIVINEVQFIPTGNLYGDWSNRKKITINSSKVTANLTNFPVLISITDSDLTRRAQPDGGDIMFIASDNTTKY